MQPVSNIFSVLNGLSLGKIKFQNQQKGITMIRSTFSPLVMTVALAALLPGTAKADSQTAAKRCVQKIQDTVDRFEWVVTDRTQETVVVIKRLLDAGRIELAIAEARECIAQSQADGRAAANYINDLADECVRRLVLKMEFSLARRVDHARNAAIDQITDILDRQEKVLSDALGL